MRNTLADVTDRLAVCAAFAGMIVPPWNLIWWSPALLVGLASPFIKKDLDAAGDYGIMLLVLPGLVAFAPFHFASYLLRKRVSRNDA